MRAGRAVLGSVAWLAIAVVLGSACSSKERPPLLGDAPNDAGLTQRPGTSTSTRPTCRPSATSAPRPASAAASTCRSPSIRPNLYFVLDRSGSMTELNKWSTVRYAIGQIMLKLGPRASFGAAVFPDPSIDGCSPGVEVAPLRRGDSPAGTYGPTILAMAYELNLTANGGTPTAATFASLAPHIAALPGKTFVILATDGGPNCDPNITCAIDQCQVNIESAAPNCSPAGPVDCCDQASYGPSNCNDTAATVTAISGLKAMGVPAYVIGVPGSAVYAGVLDQLAAAGGTARASQPEYYAVDTTDSAALLAALQQIAAKVTATCTLPLGMPPPDPSKVNVYLDGAVVPADPVNGWKLQGSVVTLVGQTCQRVLDGDVLSVRVIAGCPTVIR